MDLSDLGDGGAGAGGRLADSGASLLSSLPELPALAVRTCRLQTPLGDSWKTKEFRAPAWISVKNNLCLHLRQGLGRRLGNVQAPGETWAEELTLGKRKGCGPGGLWSVGALKQQTVESG